MGHIFSYTQADFIARFQRMLGKNVFYPIGFDDNGLPTERLVEKVKKVRAKDFTREQFTELCKEVIIGFEEEFRDLFKSLGISFDWQQEYQTISLESQKISQMSFIDLLQKQHIYREFAPCFWDVKDQTAISQAEIVDKEVPGIMYDIVFKNITNGTNITIATTRPEMLPACIAIFYHPDDERYSQLKDNYANIPLFDREIPIIADVDVEMDKGTGLVMCCTFGDIQDVTWWQRHQLEAKHCVNQYGKMINADFLNDLKISQARELVIEKLQEQNLISGQDEVIKNVKCAERSGAVLEIIITNQWFVKVLPHKEKLLAQNEKCNWRPSFMSERLKTWINGLNQNWCISRQRYFGVPFPVWYSKRKGEEGKIIIADIKELPVNPLIDLPKGYSETEVEPEQDVMDTWATSSLTPQLASLFLSEELHIEKDKHAKIFPFDLRPQAHEIIRTWAFSTLTKSFMHHNDVPWHNLMISGWCKTKDNEKMSKSKGNAVDPQKLLQQHGADVIRYWASDSKLGADVIFNEQTFKIGKKLINKLWNAAKFYADQFDGKADLDINELQKDIQNNIICMELDKWILSSLYETVAQATSLFKEYAYSDARRCIEDFFWNDLCDNYLELVKKRVYKASNQTARNSALQTLGYVFNTVLKLLSPYLPHITEEINAHLFRMSASINSLGSWPDQQQHFNDQDSLRIGRSTKEILAQIRKYKSQHNLPLNAELTAISITGSTLPADALSDLKNASNCQKIDFAPTKTDNAEISLKIEKN
jgi:valyl-tRNA synthetase